MDPKSPPPFRKQPILVPDSPLPPGSPKKKIVVEDVILPKGNKLIVRGAYVADATTHDPVCLIRASIDKLRADSLLETIPVVAVPFSDRFPNPSVAYVLLDPSFNPPDPDDEPRWDLLDAWKCALQDENPTWEVVWAPAAEGWDRRMRTRFPTLVAELEKKMGRAPSKEEIVKCLNDILKANGIAAERAFTLGTNRAGAILIHLRQADTLLHQRAINCHKILPERLQVDRTKQVEIHHPFELVVTGISPYENVEQLLVRYLTSFTDDSGDAFAGHRVPDGYRDLLVFHMTSWATARRVLADHDEFRRVFAKYPKITALELVVSLNDGTVPWKASNSDKAGKFTAELEKLTHRFDKVECNVGVRLDSTHALIANVQKTTLELTTQVTNLTTVQQHTNLALVSMQRELTLTRQRTPIEAAESSLRLLVMLGGTEEEKDKVRKNIELLKAEKASIDAQINDLQGLSLALPPPLPRAHTPPPLTPPGLPRTPANPPRTSASSQVSPPLDTLCSPPRTTADDGPSNKKHCLSAKDDGDITEPQPVITVDSENPEEGEIADDIDPNEDTVMRDAQSGST
ncbi:hypothetical protein B0H17DRAFT_1199156 [Mycena rosella]|uniref:Uncharacterized protein n=1 Tax=Mycena rosella TaxID=1033263 RepID=A0AAD7DLL1_MYCRO|nr:hypothetical protein B0H17DRAFT_1199156 [Mycena rosella]